LLYVEPIYLESKSNNLPTLVRVVVSDGRRFVMERDLRTALNKLVSPTDSTASDRSFSEGWLQPVQSPSSPLP